MESTGPSTSLEKNIDVCISQVERANTKLENIVWKLDSFEKEITKLTGIKPVESALVLLEDVSQMKQDYEKLKQDLLEIHEMQRIVQDSVRDKAYHVQARYRELRMKIQSQNFAD